MKVLYNDVQKSSINSQECKSFEIDAVTNQKRIRGSDWQNMGKKETEVMVDGRWDLKQQHN